MHVLIDIDGGPGFLDAVDLKPFPLSARPGVVLDRPGGAGPVFVASHPFPPESAARSLAAMRGERVLVCCPSPVSPALTRLALAVGRILAATREAGAHGPLPVVLCPIRPHCAWQSSGVAVPHLVSVVTDEAVQLRVTWEITDHDRILGWLAGATPVSAPSTAVAA
ncbi:MULTISPECIES: hypothetical protein [Pseudofrankia]|uniref:hypothetical protein n=1 Tax=Pseudofrankia TaxID=2994363 RepID=UPI000234C722|nr:MULTISPECIES: hypothetical protein [Pseudofrankia]OHV34087.1 hypothetical protein BCD49_24320 [Pseudofrankia sp. EUN1h]